MKNFERKPKVSAKEKIRLIRFDTNVATWLEGEGPEGDLGDKRVSGLAYVFNGRAAMEHYDNNLSASFHKLIYMGIDITGVIKIQSQDSEQNTLTDILCDLAHKNRDKFFNQYYSEQVPPEYINVQELYIGGRYGDNSIKVTYDKYSIVKRKNQREDHHWDEITQVEVNGIIVSKPMAELQSAVEIAHCIVNGDTDCIEKYLVEFVQDQKSLNP